jgi:hypothetical protein
MNTVVKTAHAVLKKLNVPEILNRNHYLDWVGLVFSSRIVVNGHL